MDVFVTPQAQKQRRRIPKTGQNKVDKKLLFLEIQPLAGKPLTGDHKGYCSLKAWSYRIIYFIKKSQKEIWVVSILHRQGVYK